MLRSACRAARRHFVSRTASPAAALILCAQEIVRMATSAEYGLLWVGWLLNVRGSGCRISSHTACLYRQDRVGLKPQSPRRGKGIDSSLAPPCRFVTVTVKLTMMPATERNGKLIAGLTPERPALGETKMMSVARTAAAQETRLLSDVTDVVAITHPTRLGERQSALV